jgi:hypothetical protein
LRMKLHLSGDPTRPSRRRNFKPVTCLASSPGSLHDGCASSVRRTGRLRKLRPMRTGQRTGSACCRAVAREPMTSLARSGAMTHGSASGDSFCGVRAPFGRQGSRLPERRLFIRTRRAGCQIPVISFGNTFGERRLGRPTHFPYPAYVEELARGSIRLGRIEHEVSRETDHFADHGGQARNRDVLANPTLIGMRPE